MTSEQFMMGNRPGGWSIRSGSLLLVLCGLLGLGSMGATAPSWPAAASVGSAVPSAPVAHAASSSFALDCLGGCSEEVLDSLEDKHDQAAAYPVLFALVSPETVPQIGSLPAPRIQTASIDSAGARAPPSA